VNDFTRQSHIEFEGFTDSALRVLEDYPWPGNVRELKNVVESIIVLEKGGKVDEYTLARYLRTPSPFERNLPVPTHRTSEQVEREFIYHALLDLKSEISKLREDLYQAFLSENRPPRSLPYYSEVLPRAPEPIQVEENHSKFDFENKTIEDLERFMINRALEKFDGSKRKAAKSLGISERTLYRKIKEYDLPY
jgi:DNA-binding NtrC family response regulator